MGAAKETSGLETKLYITDPQAGDFDVADFSDYGEVAALVVAANLVPADSIGDVARAANNITYTAYGEGEERTKAGIAGAPTIDIGLFADRNDDQVKAIMDAPLGQYVQVIIEFASSRVAAALEITVMYMQGQKSGDSKTTPKDGIGTYTFTLAITEGPSYYDQA